jgi:hypothetical protein
VVVELVVVVSVVVVGVAVGVLIVGEGFGVVCFGEKKELFIVRTLRFIVVPKEYVATK